MKYLICFMLMVECRAKVLNTRVVRQANTIPAPRSIRLVHLNDQQFLIKWSRVESEDPTDPVIGYKVKIWEWKFNDTIITEWMSDRREVCREKIPDEMPVTDVDPIYITMTDTLKALYRKVKPGHLYEVRIQAFSARTQGEVSRPKRIKFEDRSMPVGDVINVKNGIRFYWFTYY